MPEIAPCPWCEDGGKPLLFKSHITYFSYTVQCTVCFAQGPHVKFEPTQSRKTWADITEPAKADAIAKWNTRYEQTTGVTYDAEPEEKAEGLRAVG
jgi:hypothetical protein